MTKPLRPGDRAPDFRLPTANGDKVHLYSELQHTSVVLFFYVRAFTPVCTAEVCRFRDALPAFEQLGARVFGISPDGENLSRRFAAQHALSYPLLLDKGNHVRLSFGVPKLLGFLPGRATYVIGRDCTVKEVVTAGFQSQVHIADSLQALHHGAGS